MTFPRPYVPRQFPAFRDLTGASRYVLQDGKDTAATISDLLLAYPQVAVAAPANPSIGWIRKAMAPWRPLSGQTADQWVVFNGTDWDAFV